MHVAHTLVTSVEAYQKQIATIVRQARQTLGLNQQEFGIEVGCTQGNISRYESGSAMPSAVVLMHCMHICRSSTTCDTSGSDESEPWDNVATALTSLELAILRARQQSKSTRE
jgi:transcriptional regulator with XRE-family HTH domain